MRLKTESVELELELRENGSVAYVEPYIDEENPLKEDFEKHRSEFEKYRHQQAVSIKTFSKDSVKQMPEEDDACSYVSSPMVGTVYLAPSPTDAPFIKVGDTIDENTVVCIIEAMKVMNEVKASVKGIVKEVLVESGQPVDFGAKLFKLTSL